MFLKSKKGVAGTEVVIQLMIAVFVIGLLAMLIAVTGAQVLDSNGYTTSPTHTILSERIDFVNSTDAKAFAVAGYRDVACSILSAQNQSNNKTIGTANYSESSECYIVSVASAYYNNMNWTINYTYTWSAVNNAGEVINSTIQGVSDVPDNFSLWLVVGGLVVVIGLIAFVLTSLRGTGMMGA